MNVAPMKHQSEKKVKRNRRVLRGASSDRRITVSKPTVFGAKHLCTFLQRHGASRRNPPPRGSKPPRCPRGGVHRAGTRAEEGVFRDRDLSASGLRRRAGAFPDALASGNSRNPLFAAFVSSSHLTRRRKGSSDASESRPPLTGTPNPPFLSRRVPRRLRRRPACARGSDPVASGSAPS
jgi:hypothetical protein